jgi:hypothetical protein
VDALPYLEFGATAGKPTIRQLSSVGGRVFSGLLKRKGKGSTEWREEF